MSTADPPTRRPSSMPKPDAPPIWAAGTEGRENELFPTLNQEEMDTITAYGQPRTFEPGELLWDVADRNVDFFLIIEGQMEIFQRVDGEERIVATHGPGAYSGELVNMAGEGSTVAARATTPLRTIALTPDVLRDVIALEAELGEKILLSFILRRMRLIAVHLGAIVLVGTGRDATTSRIREFLSRNGVPHRVVDADDPNEASHLQQLGIEPEDTLPVVLCGDTRLVQPSFSEVADCIGFGAQLRDLTELDVAIVGGGPGGLAAAVYGASEGLNVVLLERFAFGGQAGSSSRIENYLGFPTGISGQALTGRGYIQAQKFGARMIVARSVTGVRTGPEQHEVILGCNTVIRAKALVLASGASYRRPDIEGLTRFDGVSVHYGASHLEGMLCRGKSVAIVGGGNSAGQAAMYLSRLSKEVNIMVRGSSLASSMSDYLVRRIEKAPNVHVHIHTEVMELQGDRELEHLRVKNNQTDEQYRMASDHLFVFIGAIPATDFLRHSPVILDTKGFVKTGDALSAEDLQTAHWDADRRPYFHETSVPRIFAVGDVRAGSVKRVASAVGEGSVCIQSLHRAISN